MAPDTIVAIATPRAPALRGIVRLSGPEAVALADSVFVPAPGRLGLRALARGATRGSLALDGRRAAAPALALVMRGPRSFTGEDTVELHLPGSPVLLDHVQDALIAAGARLAAPGELTRRAFLAGRIDLTRAEAVAALVRAQDEAERRCALGLLLGGLERRVATIRDRLFDVLLPIELSLDFSDQDVDEDAGRANDLALDEAAAELGDLAAGPARAAPARSAFRVVLRGPANAGKSSLFNRLLGRPAALVSPHAGTTRDVLTGETGFGPLRVLLADTAGDDVVRDAVEESARRQAERRTAEADLVLEVRALAAAPPVAAPSGEGLLVLTHADLVPPSARPPGVLAVSSVTGEGLAALREAIGARLAAEGAREGPLLVNARHRAALEEARAAVIAAKAARAAGQGGELVASDLRAALAALRRITGEDYTDALLGRIFAEFCIGK